MRPRDFLIEVQQLAIKYIPRCNTIEDKKYFEWVIDEIEKQLTRKLPLEERPKPSHIPNDETMEGLIALGLTGNEALILDWFIQHDMTVGATDIVKWLNMPRTETYYNLHNLVDKGLLYESPVPNFRTKGSRIRHKHFKLIPKELIVETLYQKNLQKLQAAKVKSENLLKL